MLAKRADAESRERFWREALQKQRSSGQTVEAWCREQGVAKQSFYGWRRRLAEPVAASTPVPSPATPVALPVTIRSLSAAPLEISWPGGVVVRVSAGSDMKLLRETLLALRWLDTEAPSC
jgi:hypothetical protein